MGVDGLGLGDADAVAFWVPEGSLVTVASRVVVTVALPAGGATDKAINPAQ